MSNESRNKKNQPPTGEGKKQSPELGEPKKIEKRSEVLQAQRGHPELNMDGSAVEPAERSGETENPKRQKAGR